MARAERKFGPCLFFRPLHCAAPLQSIKQALQGRHSCKAQGVMRAKPEMKPWVNRGHKIKSSVGAALPTHALEFIRSVVPPLWGSINVLTIITQGLRPGLCRSIALKGSSMSFLNCYPLFFAMLTYTGLRYLLASALCKVFGQTARK